MTFGVMTLTVSTPGERIGGGRLNRAAVVDEAFKFHDLRDKVQIDRIVIRADGGLDFQRHAGIPRLERRRRGGRDRESYSTYGAATATDATDDTSHISAKGLRDLRRLELGGITELADDFDDRALAALGRDAGSGEEVHALFLVQRPNDHLKLGIREHTGERGERR